MLQHSKPDDFVIASGEQHSVREFVELAFKTISIKIKWIGNGVNEKGVNEKTGETLIEIDPKYYRPTEVDALLGDPSKAKKELGWNPKETSFEKLVEIMVKHDIKLVESELRFKQSYE
jgi:GDPmannose 4,6-dehydratase